MSNLSSAQNEKWIPFLLARDGYYCRKCDLPLYKLNSKVNIDHIDNNLDNNPKDGSNYQLLCHPCNIKKGMQNIQASIEDRPYTPEMKKNLRSEPKWINWMINRVISISRIVRFLKIEICIYCCKYDLLNEFIFCHCNLALR